MKIRALISDVDQTLLDTYQFIYQAFVHAAQKYNLTPITHRQLQDHMGQKLESIYQSFYPKTNPHALAEAHRRFQEENLHLAIPFPNTIQTLQTLKNKGMKIAAVTTRSKRTSLKTLQLAGLIPYIDVVISMEDVPQGELKPHPRPILLALNMLGVPAKYAITLGDTTHDIEAGKRANTKTVGVTYGSLGEKIAQSKPDYVIDDIVEVPPIVGLSL